MFAAYRGFHRGIIPLHQNKKLIFIIDRRQWMLVPREVHRFVFLLCVACHSTESLG